MDPGEKQQLLESLESGRPEMRQTLDRAEKFLNLVALLAALLSAVAVALAARGFAGAPIAAGGEGGPCVWCGPEDMRTSHRHLGLKGECAMRDTWT